MIRAFLLASALTTGAPAQAQQCVDDVLVLLADASQSMNGTPYRLQREGYAAAFRSAEVIAQIRAGGCQAIAVAYVEFASRPETVVPLTILTDTVTAFAFADAIEAAPKPADIGALTNLEGAMEYAAEIAVTSGYDARWIVDVSSDGNATMGAHPGPVRDRYSGDHLPVWERVTFNGLPILSVHGTAEQMEVYFEEHIVGGPRSQLFPATRIEHFDKAVTRKIAKEIS
jgi:hypothetical protein